MLPKLYLSRAEKGLFQSIIYKWSRYKSTGQINYPSNCSSTGLSEWVRAKQNNSDKNQETWRVRKTNALWIFSQNKIKCSGQLSLRTTHIHPPVISFFFILWTRREASFAQLIPAISIVVFSLLHYANWIGSIPAQIISSCQKDYHIIKGETLLNFNQPGLITMYMQMLNFTSFFSAPSGP